MSGLLYALVLLGCSDDGDSCHALDAGRQQFASRRACMSQLDAAMASDIAARADYPSVSAVCKLATASREPNAPPSASSARRLR